MVNNPHKVINPHKIIISFKITAEVVPIFQPNSESAHKVSILNVFLMCVFLCYQYYLINIAWIEKRTKDLRSCEIPKIVFDKMANSKPDMSKLHRLAAEREYRIIPCKLTMLLKMKEDTGASLSQIESLEHGTRWQIYRAQRAIESGREIGTVGRPRKLNEESERELLSIVREQQRQNKLFRFRDLNRKVFSSFFRSVVIYGCSLGSRAS